MKPTTRRSDHGILHLVVIVTVVVVVCHTEVMLLYQQQTSLRHFKVPIGSVNANRKMSLRLCGSQATP